MKEAMAQEKTYILHISFYTKLLLFIVIITFLLFLTYTINSLLFSSLGYDESVFASVAKNFAFGNGYSLTYHDKILFSPGISTGPTIIIPAAIGIKIFGNAYYVARASTLAFNLALLVLIFFYSKRIIKGDSYLSYLLICIYGILFLSSEPSGTHLEGGFLRLWYQCLGDIPSSLLIVLSIIISLSNTNKISYLVYGGLLTGLAINSKTISLLSLPALIFLPMAHVFLCEQNSNDKHHKRLFFAYFAFTVSAMLPPFLWVAYKMFVIIITSNDFSQAEYRWTTLIASDKKFFTNSGSGLQQIGQSNNLVYFFYNKLRWNIVRLKDQFNGYIPFFIILSVMAFTAYKIVMNYIKTGLKCKQSVLVLLFIVASISHLTWWLFFSKNYWIRHAEQGIIYFIFALSMGVTLLPEKRKWIFIGLVLLSFILPRYDYISKLFSPLTSPENGLLAMEEAANKIRTLKSEANAIFVGCDPWVAWDLEFIEPDFLNFYDCNRLPQEDYSKKEIYLVRNKFWNWGELDELAEFEKSCDQEIIFNKSPYKISRCRHPPKVTF